MLICRGNLATFERIVLSRLCADAVRDGATQAYAQWLADKQIDIGHFGVSRDILQSLLREVNLAPQEVGAASAVLKHKCRMRDCLGDLLPPCERMQLIGTARDDKVDPVISTAELDDHPAYAVQAGVAIPRQ